MRPDTRPTFITDLHQPPETDGGGILMSLASDVSSEASADSLEVSWQLNSPRCLLASDLWRLASARARPVCTPCHLVYTRPSSASTSVTSGLGA